MSLETKDLELIDKLMSKASDDMAVTIARSFERLEERVDALEARITSRISDVEEKIEAVRQDMSDEIGDVKEELREMHRMRDLVEMV